MKSQSNLESGGAPTRKQREGKNTNRKPTKRQEFSERQSRLAKTATKDAQGSRW